MKKSVKILGTIAVLGVILTGSSWYTGKIIEKDIPEVFSNANKELQSHTPLSVLSISYKDYQRGLFSSKMHIVLKAVIKKTPDEKFESIKEIVLNGRIDHGPFPLGNVKKLNLLPSAASIHTELEKNDSVRDLFEITNGYSLFSSDSSINYSGDVSSVINIIPVEYENKQNKLKFDGAEISLDFKKSITGMKVGLKSNAIILNSTDSLDRKILINIGGLSFDSNTHPGPSKLTVGDQKMVISKISVSAPGVESGYVEKLSFVSKIDEDNGNAAGRLDYVVDTLKINNIDFGSGEFSAGMLRVDSVALKSFYDSYNNLFKKIFTKGDDTNTLASEYESQMGEVLIKNAQSMLKRNPAIDIGPLKWKNTQGESSALIHIDLQEPAGGLDLSKGPQSLPEMLKKVEIQLLIPGPMLTEVLTRKYQLDGATENVAQNNAKEIVQTLVQTGNALRISKFNDDKISSHFIYENKNILFNDEKLTLEEFIGRASAFNN